MDHENTAATLASALPAGIYYDAAVNLRWDTARVARFQTERLAEAGYVLVHTAPDEATAERLARGARPVLFGGRPDDEVGPGTRYERNQTREFIRGFLAALGAPEQTGPDDGQGEAVSR